MLYTPPPHPPSSTAAIGVNPVEKNVVAPPALLLPLACDYGGAPLRYATREPYSLRSQVSCPRSPSGTHSYALPTPSAALRAVPWWPRRHGLLRVHSLRYATIMNTQLTASQLAELFEFLQLRCYLASLDNDYAALAHDTVSYINDLVRES